MHTGRELAGALGSVNGVMDARGSYRARNAGMGSYLLYGQGSGIVGTNPQSCGPFPGNIENTYWGQPLTKIVMDCWRSVVEN